MKKTTVLFINFCCFMLPGISLVAQQAEKLANDIAKTYCDSLTLELPLIQDREDYFKVEFNWSKKIVLLKEKELKEYFNLTGSPLPEIIVGEEETSLFADKMAYITRKAIKGCPFYQGLYGKGTRKDEIKPCLVETGDAICNCLTPKLPTATIQDFVNSMQEEFMQILYECNMQAGHSRDCIEACSVKGEAPAERYSKLLTGYILTNCPKVVESVGLSTAQMWVRLWQSKSMERVQKLFEEDGKYGWDLMEILKKSSTKKAQDQFVNDKAYENATLELTKIEKAIDEHPGAFFLRMPTKEQESGVGRVHELFFSEDNKVLFQVIVEYQTNTFDKVTKVTFIPRGEIKNLKEIEDYLETIPPPPPPPPPFDRG